MNNGVLIENLSGRKLPGGLEAKMLDVAEATLALHCGYDADVFISIVDEGEILRLNQEARGIDSPTDVLSFPYIDFGSQSLEQAAATIHMCNPETGRLMLGDIVICLPIAERQAEEYGHGLVREMCFLAVHGLLHLLGFDHENEEEASIMFSEQNKILSQCGIER